MCNNTVPAGMVNNISVSCHCDKICQRINFKFVLAHGLSPQSAGLGVAYEKAGHGGTAGTGQKAAPLPVARMQEERPMSQCLLQGHASKDSTSLL